MTSPADSSSPLFDAIRPAPGSGDGLDAMLAHFAQLAPVFDALPDVAFFVKDVDGRYVLANRTLAQRCGFKEKRELYGKTTEEVFPRRFGRNYLEQDMATIHAGQQLTDQLEL
ncbi:PAS domain-containing protein, partial [Burkholderia anthina]